MIGSSPARGMMKHRVTFERNFSLLAARATDVDGFGQKVEDWRELCTVACHAWHAGSGGTQSNEYRTVTREMPGMMVPLGTDIKTTDRVKSVVDRAGARLFGPMLIDFVATRTTHMEITMSEAS